IMATTGTSDSASDGRSSDGMSSYNRGSNSITNPPWTLSEIGSLPDSVRVPVCVSYTIDLFARNPESSRSDRRGIYYRSRYTHRRFGWIRDRRPNHPYPSVADAGRPDGRIVSYTTLHVAGKGCSGPFAYIVLCTNEDPYRVAPVSIRQRTV